MVSSRPANGSAQGQDIVAPSRLAACAGVASVATKIIALSNLMST
jgi:hypothetical protein